jgi:hypothetical protein
VGVVVVTTDLTSLYEHYLEMRDIQIKGSPEYNAYNFLVSRLWCGRGASLSFQRIVVESILHEIEHKDGLLWVNVVRSLKRFLSKTGEAYGTPIERLDNKRSREESKAVRTGDTAERRKVKAV